MKNMLRLIQRVAPLLLVTASIVLPLAARADADNDIQDAIYKLNKAIASLVAKQGKDSVETKAKLVRLVDQSKLFDWEAMGCHVLTWREFDAASATQRKLFTENFKQMMAGAYASTFMDRPGTTPVFSSFSERKSTPNHCGYEVSGVLQADYEKKTDEPKARSMVYLLSNANAKKSWRILGIKYVGMDYLDLYQTQFANQMAVNGLDGLIEKIKERNAR